MILRIAGLVSESVVDGPGIRLVIFTQGCYHACAGCHNPETHHPYGGYKIKIQHIVKEIDKNPLLSGVTFSGGEPFLQPDPLIVLGSEIKKRGLHLIIYTGYLFETLLAWKNESVLTLMGLTDIIVDGPYIEQQRDLTLKFRGSKNQRVIDVVRSLQQNKTIVTEF